MQPLNRMKNPGPKSPMHSIPLVFCICFTLFPVPGSSKSAHPKKSLSISALPQQFQERKKQSRTSTFPVHPHSMCSWTWHVGTGLRGCRGLTGPAVKHCNWGHFLSRNFMIEIMDSASKRVPALSTTLFYCFHMELIPFLHYLPTLSSRRKDCN